MIEISTFTSQGKNKLNQDAIMHLKSKNNIYLFAIADGMGGEAGGNLASNYSLNIIQDLFLDNDQIKIKDIFKSVSHALEKLSIVTKYTKMATTLTILIIKENKAYVGHVGDCRIYHLRKDGIMSRTSDQTELQKLLDEKIITKSLAENYHRKNILLSVMSSHSQYELQERSFDILSKDRILLLSDGVYNVVKNKVYIRDISLEENNIHHFSVRLEQSIKSEKIIDDYSCISIDII